MLTLHPWPLRGVHLALAVPALLHLIACGGDTGGSGSGDRDAHSDQGDLSTDPSPDSTDSTDSADPGDVPTLEVLDLGDEEATSDVTSGAVGDPCDGDEDCESFLCLDLTPGAGGGVCSTYCAQDVDCPDGYDCVILSNDGGDVTQLCVAIDLCIDADEDGYGVGPGCDGPDCDDESADSSPISQEICDDRDNDCDNVVDDTPIGSNEDCETGFSGDCAEGRTQCVDGLLQCVPRGGISEEVCDDRDNDCDGERDEEATDAATWYRDADGDGRGDAAVTAVLCDPDDGWVASSDDCDDASPTSFPSASEICDGLDNDCDGEADEGVDYLDFWLDADGDGHGDAAQPPVSACSVPEGYSVSDDDCDDADPDRHPGAVELPADSVDSDCDGQEACYLDIDGDGWRPDGELVLSSADSDCTDPGEASNGTPAGDCNDTASDAHPGASEVCDGIDNDCNGEADEAAATDARTWYLDGDSDGFGDPGSATLACGGPDFHVLTPGDCDDAQSTVNPNATELCDGADNDCDGEIDEPDAADVETWFADADGDRFGDPAQTTVACLPPPGYVADSTDCDDLVSEIHPAATELCDAVDNDCDAEIDEPEATGAPTWFRDVDGDLFGNPAVPQVACEAPAGYVADATDCDDGRPLVFPGGSEICNGLDDDCNGEVDDSAATGSVLWYADADFDGFGDSAVSQLACAQPPGFVLNDLDCDDADATVSPGADETCDGIDNNCDLNADDPSSVDAWRGYFDEDDDGWGLDGDPVVACTLPSGYVLDPGDCDDTDPSVYPGADEVAGDGVDMDCDGNELCFVDADADGHAIDDMLLSADSDCADPGEAWSVADRDDCDDFDGAIHPGRAEIPGDGTDSDCDGAELCLLDADEDFFSSTSTLLGDDMDCDDAMEAWASEPSGDCNDGAPSIFPGAVEGVGDGVDQDCTDTELCFVDADNDGHAIDSAVLSADLLCDSSGEAWNVEPRDDCDDANSAAHPGATESVGDGVDLDCNGAESCRVDVDDDGHAVDASVISADLDCDDSGEAWSSEPIDDCNDVAPTIFPGAVEGVGDSVDQDCTGTESCYVDADDDGWAIDSTVVSVDTDCDDSGEAAAGDPRSDCDDSNPAVNPWMTETAGNEIDENCDDVRLCYQDLDNDAWGTASIGSAPAGQTCDAASNWSTTASDCDDSLSWVNPGATEAVGNETDENCDNYWLCYWDGDDDHYGQNSTGLAPWGQNCTNAANWSWLNTDCDDSRNWINPGATESAGNETDENCDNIWLCYWDGDNDNYGQNSAGNAPAGQTCTSAPNWSWLNTDCNDGNPGINPGAAETAGNDSDENCDDIWLCYWDGDNDNYGQNSAGNAPAGQTCTSAPNWSWLNTDCHDSSAAIYPGALERCDGWDNNCSGASDEGACPGSCSGRANPSTNRGYMFCDPGGINRNNAQNNYCNPQGMDLVEINDATENDWVRSTGSSVWGSWGHAWIGLNDTAQEGVYRWQDGDPLGYSNWNGGEPNNWGGNEDCADISNSDGGRWIDVGCSQSRDEFICEWR